MWAFTYFCPHGCFTLCFFLLSIKYIAIKMKIMNRLTAIFFLMALGIGLVSCVSKKNDSSWLQNAITLSEQQLLLASQQFKDSAKNPRTFEHGKVELVTERDWTSGFFPGSLWISYQLTGNEALKTEAERFSSFVENAKYRTNTHDLGFILNCSYGHAYKVTNASKYKEVMIIGANTLMTRYNKNIGLIKSWDKIVGPWEFPVIIDNMMNLEFLYEVGLITNNEEMIKAAISHADITLNNHFRKNNSSYHVLDYDSISGEVKAKETHQGYSHGSSWARGQAWGLYGFTMMYRYTKKPEYIEQAKNIAAFILQHQRLPKDLIPYWDFDAPNIPNEPRDASAAAVIASALLELSGYVNDGSMYFDAAETILRNLSSENYFAKTGENGFFILKHSTGNWPKKSEIDTPLSYADYYYLEALLRYKNITQK